MAHNLKRCPFGCGKKILPYWVACSLCWYALDQRQRAKMHDLIIDHLRGRVDDDEYERRVLELRGVVETPW
jgi:hypothetical protein